MTVGRKENRNERAQDSLVGRGRGSGKGKMESGVMGKPAWCGLLETEIGECRAGVSNSVK